MYNYFLVITIILYPLVMIASESPDSFDKAKVARTVKILTKRLNSKVPHEVLAQIALKVVNDSAYFKPEERLSILLQTAAAPRLRSIVRDSLISYLYEGCAPYSYKHKDLVDADKNQPTPLEMAESDFPHLVQYLVPQDPVIFRRIAQAVEHDNWSELTMILRKYPRNKEKILQYVLWQAIYHGNIHLINKLMDFGISPDTKGIAYGKELTPLLSWVRSIDNINPDLRIAKVLLANGCNVNAQDKYGCTALYHASFIGNLPVVELLLKYGADPNLANLKGQTPLFAAAMSASGSEQGILDTVHRLIKAGADTLAKDKYGNDILVKALEANNYEIAEILKNYPNHHQQQINEADGDLALVYKNYYFQQLEKNTTSK